MVNSRYELQMSFWAFILGNASYAFDSELNRLEEASKQRLMVRAAL